LEPGAANTLDQLLARWRQGDEQAAEELFHRYASRLIGLARSRMPTGLNQRLDPEDIVQSVCRSFFKRTRAGEYEVSQGGDLWHLLVTLTLHKLTNQIVHHKAAKRACSRETHFGSEDSLHGLHGAALAREPSPLEAMLLTDEVERLMRMLDPLHRQILELRLQGFTLEEIAGQTGRTERTIRRVLDQVKTSLEQRRSTGEP
jgi:RNA polymerase sigma-70 factor, ECF subfamily